MSPPDGVFAASSNRGFITSRMIRLVSATPTIGTQRGVASCRGASFAGDDTGASM